MDTAKTAKQATSSTIEPGRVPRRWLIGWTAMLVGALGAGCASPPPPAALDLAKARIVPMSAAPALDVSGLPGGKAVGAIVGAGTGSGAGVLIGGAACLSTGPFFPLCLAVVLPTTTAIGAVSGAAIGAVRTESLGAIETKTKALRDEMAATPYSDMLARQLGERLASDLPLGTMAPVAAATSLTERDDDRPWTIEVGVTEVGTEGKGEFALRLVTTVRVHRYGTAVFWQVAKEVQSDRELTTDQWLADDAVALHEVLNRCIAQASRQLKTDFDRATHDAAGKLRPAAKYSSSCGDRVAPVVQVSGS